jgi:uncharacterized coiled-coil protein SlyX
VRTQLEQRIAELESEFQAGQTMLADLHTKQTDLQQTLLRISGAIQVLKELLEASPAEDAAPPSAALRSGAA